MFYIIADQALINLFIEEFRPDSLGDYYLWFALLTLMMSIGLPRQVAAFSSGYLLGTGYGTLFATLAASIACLFTFVAARFIFHRSLSKRFPKQLSNFSAFFTHDVLIKAFIIRLIPAGSNFLTNVLAGTAKAPLFPYLSGSMLGFIPQMIVFSMLGSGINVGSKQQIVISICLLLVAAGLTGYLYRSGKLNIMNKKA
ncbi:DedA family protein [Thalassotalea profundi]|uniref:TVP38/TMEM64 family membrane protein n=1 Tax=Thalassotalea profundi TaxID=2036687 RepID=A0ABQ3IQ64_9GAMM|nr:DedA family protein [Thalassotalea profundi]